MQVTNLNLHHLHAYLSERLPDMGLPEALQATSIAGGQSNPTWVLHTPTRRMVLRAKPAKTADLLPSAHAIEREVKVQTALAGSGVPVPRILCHCEDEDVLGVAFYVMDFVEGRVLRDSSLADEPLSDRCAIHFHAMRVLAELHRTPWQTVGLADFGRSSGYAARTIKRWAQQYAATCATPLPFMVDWQAWLNAHLPPETPDATTLVHGDYRLENLMIGAIDADNHTEVVAVLDWELSTLGDPLSDLAYYCMAWHNPQGLLRGIGHPDPAACGLPTEVDMVAMYCKHAGRAEDEVWAHWPFYLSLNYFRLTAILQGVADRVAKGQTRNPTAQAIGELTPLVADIGWRIAQGGHFKAPN